VVLVAVMSPGVLAVTAQAQAVSVGCGSVVTANVMLSNDLQRCPGDGLVVAADGVTVDLAGHTIGGSGQGVGIRVLSSHVSVRNGSIERFGTGIQTTSEPRSLGTMIVHISVSRNSGDGVLLGGSLESISDSIATVNGSSGIHLADALLATVSGNDVFRNRTVGILGGPHSDGAVYTKNKVFENGGDGISTSESVSVFTFNTISRNGGNGIEVHESAVPSPASFYIFQGNVTDENMGHGILACYLNRFTNPINPCDGGFSDGGGNAAKHNTVEPQCVNITCAFNRGQARRLDLTY
jgi:hypothetical protein